MSAQTSSTTNNVKPWKPSNAAIEVLRYAARGGIIQRSTKQCETRDFPGATWRLKSHHRTLAALQLNGLLTKWYTITDDGRKALNQTMPLPSVGGDV